MWVRERVNMRVLVYILICGKIIGQVPEPILSGQGYLWEYQGRGFDTRGSPPIREYSM